MMTIKKWEERTKNGIFSLFKKAQDKVQDKPTSLKTILNFSECFPAKKVIQ